MAQREKTKITATAEASIATTGDGLSHMLGGPAADLLGGAAAATPACANRPTIKALMDLAHPTEEGASPASTAATAAKAKAKAKSKAKAKQVNQQQPKTPAEKRAAIRILAKFFPGAQQLNIISNSSMGGRTTFLDRSMTCAHACV